MSSEMMCLQIITEAGNARSKYIEAIQAAKANRYEACNELLKQGNEAYAKGHRIHADLLNQEAGGNKTELDLLLVHAEDQLMSAESFKVLCSEFLDIYRRFDAVEKR